MKVKDIFVGFKLATMLPIFHIAYFLAISTLPKEETVPECSILVNSLTAIWWLHMVGTIVTIVSIFTMKYRLFTFT
jgi:hypothetical protein